MPGEYSYAPNPVVTVVCDGTSVSSSNQSGNQTGNQSGTAPEQEDLTQWLGLPKNSVYSRSEMLKASSSTFIYSSSVWDGQNCSGRMISRTEEGGTYTLGAKGTNSTYPITINRTTAKAAIFPADAVSYANSNPDTSGCGMTGWLSAMPQDIFTSSKCAPTHELPKQVRIESNSILFEDEGQFKDADKMPRQ